jgi:2-C-methyl-D-erythritol 4-phosphate cytidylyltransferase/2-C-methyl-D-erythritol 2,4-cyclodiphosphate synthase
MGNPLPKQFLLLAGTPVIIHTIRAFKQVSAINEIILVVPTDHIPLTKKILHDHNLEQCCTIVSGGQKRQDSVEAGMNAAGETDFLIVHDGVRPLIDKPTIEECLEAAKKHGAAIVAVPVNDTLKQVTDKSINNTVNRTGLWRAQTPQAARKSLLEKAYKTAHATNFIGTDESSLLENMDCMVVVIDGSEKNIKITHPEDILLAEALLMDGTMKAQRMVTKIGHGYDAHRLVTGRPLVLGGVTIPHTLGLLGHSDADVLTHALCDALLGSVGSGDIGQHFPDSDPAYKGIESLILLEQVVDLLTKKGYCLGNADITIIAQQPKLARFLPEMQKKLTAICKTSVNSINIKATTTEEMGFAGRQEGIACHAVVTVNSDLP